MVVMGYSFGLTIAAAKEVDRGLFQKTWHSCQLIFGFVAYKNSIPRIITLLQAGTDQV